MPGLFRGVPPTPERQRAHDVHRHGVALAVVAAIALYAYLFTDVSARLGVPAPGVVAGRLGLESRWVFTDEHVVQQSLRIVKTRRFETPERALSVYFLLLAGAFLSAYYLPLERKQGALVLWSGLALALLYGPQPAAALLAAHLAVYLALHPGGRDSAAAGAGFGAALWLAFLSHAPGRWLWAAALPAATWLAYRFAGRALLRHPAAGAVAQRLVVHSAILTVGFGALWNGLGQGEWRLPLGLLLFCWQWQRVFLYHLDLQDGLVPADLPLHRYLAVFWTPAVIPNWYWGVSTGQGYAYVNHNHLCEDKNKIALDGLRIWGVALLYLVLGSWATAMLVKGLAVAGLSMHGGSTRVLVADFIDGDRLTAASVLATTLTSVIAWILYVAGMLHFKVGVWRVCGYRMDPDFDRPWLSTNLAVFWSRFMFHYRAFLVRAFYYPAFFEWFKGLRQDLRLWLSVVAAAGLGNWLWGHLTERLYGHGITVDSVVYELARFPYFLLLALGIAFSQWFLLRRDRRRRPWTLDRWLWTDVLAAYATMQYYALALIFARPSETASIKDLLKVFLAAFGCRLSGV